MSVVIVAASEIVIVSDPPAVTVPATNRSCDASFIVTLAPEARPKLMLPEVALTVAPPIFEPVTKLITFTPAAKAIVPV